jgi:zinc and cadmium transporter
MQAIIQIMIAVFVVSIISILGIFIFMKQKFLNKILFYMISFAAGSMLGAVFFDMLPEILESGYTETIPFFIVGGILSFFILEKFLHWHHHHSEKKETHPFTYLNLIGDGIHNFFDGAIIAVSFMQSTALGMVATIAIVAHEIPQEISDFAVLIYGGFTKAKALLYNFLTALTAFAGAFLAYFYSSSIEHFGAYFLAIAMGHFIYIASADLIPEMHKEKNIRKSLLQFLMLSFGILLVWLVGEFFHGH